MSARIGLDLIQIVLVSNCFGGFSGIGTRRVVQEIGDESGHTKTDGPVSFTRQRVPHFPDAVFEGLLTPGGGDVAGEVWVAVCG